MAFTGIENHDINLETASELTENYRNSYPHEIKGFYYSKLAITSILNQTNCVGVRIYYAQGNDGSPELVISGVKANEDDMETGLLAEFGLACPSRCSTPNDLNS